MQKNLLKEFIHYILSNIGSMMALSFYILIDTYYVSKGCGSIGLAALNLAIPIYSLVYGTSMMIATGAAIKFVIHKSRGHQRAGNQIYTNAMYLGIFFGILYFVIGMVASDQVSYLLGADSETFEMGMIYMKITFLFAPLFMVSSVLNAFVRNDGSPTLAAIASASGCLSNVLFDYIFIMKMNMGMFGAVLATGFSPGFNLLVLLPYLIMRKNSFHLDIQLPSPRAFIQIIPLGLSALINELSSGIVIIVYNLLILGLRGNIGVAAYGVVANISLVVASTFTGIAQGIQPLTSRSYGEGNRKNVSTIFKYAMVTLILVSAVTLLIIEAGAGPITQVFNTEQNAELQLTAVRGLRLYFLATPLMGFNIIMSLFFASTEKAIPSQAVSIMRGFLVLIPAAILLSGFLKMDGIWLSLPVTEAIVAIFAGIVYIRTKK